MQSAEEKFNTLLAPDDEEGSNAWSAFCSTWMQRWRFEDYLQIRQVCCSQLGTVGLVDDGQQVERAARYTS